MKIKNTVFLIAAMLFITAGFTLPAAAQMPMEINFQGRLLDNQGEPVSGTKDIIFRVYDGEEGGSAIFEQAPVNVLLDDEGFYITAIDLSNIDDFDRGLYISVEIEGDDEMSPRLKILPSATAIYSWQSSYAAESGTASYSLYAATAAYLEGEIDSALFALQAGTASYALHAATASFLLGQVSTASYSHQAATAAFSYNAGYSLYSGTASYSLHAATASHLLGSVESALYAHQSATAAYSLRAATAAYSLYSATASFAYDSSLLEGRSYDVFLSISGGQLGGSLDMNTFSLLNVSSVTSPGNILYLPETIALGAGEAAESIGYDEGTSSIHTSTTITVNGNLIIDDTDGSGRMIMFMVDIDTNTAPSSAGIIGTDSKWNIYISTGNQEGQWSRLNNP